MVTTITYNNKVAINENPNIADVNKVKDDDMNEIKSVVNNNATELSNTETAVTNLATAVTKAFKGEKGKIGSNQMTTYQSGSSTYRLYNLTFSNTYTNPPIVVASLYDNEKYNLGIEKVAVGNITNTGCELLLGVNINSSSYGITYIVISND